MPIDPTILQAGPKTDAMVAEWMGWHLRKLLGETWGDKENQIWWCCPAAPMRPESWSPSTNPAHAGEARRKAARSFVEHGDDAVQVAMGVVGGGKVHWHSATVSYSEVTGDTEEEIKAKAEALATCRAIAEKMKAEEAAGGE